MRLDWCNLKGYAALNFQESENTKNLQIYECGVKYNTYLKVEMNIINTTARNICRKYVT